MEPNAEKLKEKIEALENEIAAKDRELNTKVVQLLHANELLKSIVLRLEDLNNTAAHEKNQKIKILIADLINVTSDDLWEQFEITFVKVHPSFYTGLFRKHPNLTANER